MSEKPCVVLVDSLTPRDYFLPVIAERGCDIVHVTSTFEPESYYYEYALKANERNKDKYVANLDESMGLPAIIERLKTYQPVAVINSSEAGTLLSDQIAHALGLPGNDIALSEARRDKFKMQEAIRCAGLRSIRAIASDNVDEVCSWIQAHDLLPVVVKPLDSGGSDGVKQCRTLDDVVAAFNALLNHKNIIGLMNRKVLVEEFIVGKEIAVNTVSLNGKAVVSDLWRYAFHWINGKMVYDHSLLVEQLDKNHDRIIQYTFDVLSALGIQFGAAHTELMITEDDEPVLMETGTRPMGGATPLALYQQSLYHTQFSLVLDACLNAGRFEQIRQAGYRVKKPMLFKLIIASVAGQLDKLTAPEHLPELASYYDCDFSDCLKKGRIEITRDFFTTPGMVYLTADDQATLMQDVATLQRWEQHEHEKLFTLQAPTEA